MWCQISQTRLIKGVESMLFSRWASSWGLYSELIHNTAWCFTITVLCDSRIFVILRDSPLLSCIWCQFAVLGRILLSEEILSKSSSSLIKKHPVLQPIVQTILVFLFGCFGINVHRSLDVFMPHNRLDNLQVGLFFAKPCTECVTQIVCRKVWKQNRITVLFLWCHFFALIVICNDSLDSTIYRLRIGDIAETATKDKSCHSVNFNIVPARLFLLFPQHFKGIFHGIKHRDCPNASIRFRLWDMLNRTAVLANRVIN